MLRGWNRLFAVYRHSAFIMHATHTIREAVAQVNALRQQSSEAAALGQAVRQVKQLQARRFAASYADLLATEPYCHAARFFLDELYGERDFTQRDNQFARIAAALERLFPKEVVATAVALAQLHALSEDLDLAMARAWQSLATTCADKPYLRYVFAWQHVGQAQRREEQLQSVLTLGRDLGGLTRTPGLRLMLRMMRRPAAVAQLADLQRFLETGFDCFSALTRTAGTLELFFTHIETRERSLMQTWFTDSPVAGATQLQTLLG